MKTEKEVTDSENKQKKISELTDPENRKISYTYDLLDRITNVTEGETQTAQYEYDSVGNLTKYIDGNNLHLQQVRWNDIHYRPAGQG